MTWKDGAIDCVPPLPGTKRIGQLKYMNENCVDFRIRVWWHSKGNWYFGYQNGFGGHETFGPFKSEYLARFNLAQWLMETGVNMIQYANPEPAKTNGN